MTTEMALLPCPLCKSEGFRGGNGMTFCRECTAQASNGDWDKRAPVAQGSGKLEEAMELLELADRFNCGIYPHERAECSWHRRYEALRTAQEAEKEK